MDPIREKRRWPVVCVSLTVVLYAQQMNRAGRAKAELVLRRLLWRRCLRHTGANDDLLGRLDLAS
jgi:hypothetical protein